MKKIIKWSAVIIIGLFVLMIIIGATTGGSKNSDVKQAFQQGMDQAKQTVNSTDSPEKKIEARVRSSVSSDIIKDVQITKQYKGGYSVLVSTNEPGGFTNGQTKTAIWMDMGNIYTSLYKQPMGVNQAAVVAYTDLVDKYGKTSSQVVMKTSLDKSEAQKVNWNEVQSTLDLMILPKVWTTDEINPSLR